MLDYTPFYRSSVGFDRLFRLLDEAQGVEAPTYPPYNIERTAENAYRITIAVAGFGDYEIAGLCVPSLTTINPLPGEIGKRAAELILDVLDHKQTGPVTIALEPILMRRQSSP